MQHLSEKWLRPFNYYYILYFLGTIGVYAYFVYTQNSLDIQNAENWGSSFPGAILALIGLLYNIFFLRHVKKYNLGVAYLVSFGIFGVTNNIAVEVAINSKELFFLFNSYLTSISAAFFGPIVAITILGISGVILGMEIAGNIGTTAHGLIFDTLAFLIRSVMVAFLLYSFRNKYVSLEKNQSYIERYFVNNEVVSLLTNSISDGVILLDKNSIIRSINPAGLEIIGKEAQETITFDSKKVLKFKQVNGDVLDTTEEPINLAFKHGKAIHKELKLAKKDKDIFIDVTASIIANEQTQELYGMVLILRDISKKKREEAAKSEFISTASHEMRTPVAAIEGNLALALNPKTGNLDLKTKSFIENAYGSTQHLAQLFQDLLVSSKADDGRLISHPEVVELSKIIGDQVDYFSKVAQKKNLKLEFIAGVDKQENSSTNNENNPKYYVYADPSRIKEVASNLIDNAIKYTDEGKVSIGITGNSDLVQFFVRDTGVGIPQEDIPHLFQKFYRVDSSITRTTGGTGLGLYICKKIVDLCQGRIWVESDKEVGSIFYVDLPRLDSEKAKELKNKN